MRYGISALRVRIENVFIIKKKLRILIYKIIILMKVENIFILFFLFFNSYKIYHYFPSEKKCNGIIVTFYNFTDSE